MASVSPPVVGLVLANALAAAVAFALAVYVALRGEDDPVLWPFGLLLTAITVWTAASAAEPVVTGRPAKLLWRLVAASGAAVAPPAFLAFVLRYTGRGRYVTRTTGALLAVEPTLALALLATNGGHGLYYRSVGLVGVAGTPLLATTPGSALWLHAFYLAALVGVGVVLLVRFALVADGLYRLQTATLVAGALLPPVAALAGVVGLGLGSALRPAPPAVALSAALVFAGVAYGRFANLLPVDRAAVLAAVDDGVVVTDGDDRIRYLNPAARATLGRPTTDDGRTSASAPAPDRELVGRPLRAVLPAADIDPGATVEARVERDKRERWIWIRRVGLDATAGAAATVVVLTDVTERRTRRQRRDRLRRTARRLVDADGDDETAAVAVETARDGFDLPLSAVLRTGPTTDGVERLAATDAGRTALGTDGGPIRPLIERAVERGEPVVRHDLPDAEAGPVRSAIVHPLPGHGAFVLAARTPGAFDAADVTLSAVLAATLRGSLDRAESWRELRDSERRLRRQNDRLEEFATVVSHDLRSPLNAATGYLELLAEDHDDPRLDRAERAIGRTCELVDDLLALARQGRTVDEPRPVDVDEVAERAWESVSTSGATLSVAPGLGTVAADRSRLRQVFENLFRNGVEHGATAGARTTGDASVTIRVGPLPDGFYVADDGPGIPPDRRDEVFDAGHSDAPEGTGLGLAIVRRIVEAHGWTIRATAARPGGARFELTTDDGPAAETDSDG